MKTSNFPLVVFTSICKIYNKYLFKKDITQEYKQFIKSKICLEIARIKSDILNSVPVQVNSNKSNTESNNSDKNIEKSENNFNDNLKSTSIIKILTYL